MDISKWINAFFVLFFLTFFQTQKVFAYTDLTHEQITRSAFQFMKTHDHIYPESSNWFERLGNDQTFMEELLIRSVVDTDFRTNLWIDALFHEPFAGGTNKVNFSMFTTLFHFINTTQKGTYWDYDGYSFTGSSKGGDDGYLGTFSVSLKGELSTPLGGDQPSPNENQSAFDVGLYKTGFKGSIQEWNKMFFSGKEAASAVFPPSYVPGVLAYNKLLYSEKADSNETSSWVENFPVIDGVFTTKKISRHFWRGQVQNLPKRFELLGMVMHLMQDLSVPHHSLGVIDWCHAEYEDQVDNLSCDTESPNRRAYTVGDFEGNTLSQCQSLYDPEFVSYYLKSLSFLDVKNKMNIKERFLALAFWSAQWKWASFGDTGDFTTMSTILPTGTRYDADSCGALFKIRDVQTEVKRRYNMAVATSVALFEFASHDYQTLSRFKTFEQSIFQILQNKRWAY